VDFQRFMSIASFSNPSIWAEPFSRDLVDSQNKLTFGRRCFNGCSPLSNPIFPWFMIADQWFDGVFARKM
jgi:hypothetical protein